MTKKEKAYKYMQDIYLGLGLSGESYRDEVRAYLAGYQQAQRDQYENWRKIHRELDYYRKKKTKK